MRKLLALTATLLLLSSQFGHADTSLLPMELLDGARKLGYEQVATNYYQRPGKVDPPYVYGALSEDKDMSAIFWALETGSKGQYALLLMHKGQFSIIYKTKNYPRGLSTNKVEKLGLRNYRYIENNNDVGEGKTLGSGILIEDIYDGVGSTYCFYEGKWLIRDWD